jgi:hypothetical protein
MGWVEYVARTGKKRNVCRVLVGNPQRKNHFEELWLDGIVVLKLTLKKWDGKPYTGSGRG